MGAHVKHHYCFFFNLLGGTSAFSYAGSSLLFFFLFIFFLYLLGGTSAFGYAGSSLLFFLLYYTLTGCEGDMRYAHI